MTQHSNKCRDCLERNMINNEYVNFIQNTEKRQFSEREEEKTEEEEPSFDFSATSTDH